MFAVTNCILKSLLSSCTRKDGTMMDCAMVIAHMIVTHFKFSNLSLVP